MKVACPVCQTVIPSSELDATADVAVCRRCDETFPLSSLVAEGQTRDAFDLSRAPAGAWYEDTGTGCQIGATTRSPIAFLFVPFACLWSGYSMGAIYGTQIANGQFNLRASLLGIPFVIGSLILGTLALMAVCGQVVVSNDRGQGCVFTGIGFIGWNRRFEWQSIRAVKERFSSYAKHGRPTIALAGQTRIAFGTMLNDERRDFMFRGLQKLLSRARSI